MYELGKFFNNRFLKAVHLFSQDFPEKAWEPKVQLPFNAEPGQVPRKIEIERYLGHICVLAEHNLHLLTEHLPNMFSSFVLGNCTGIF